MQPINAKGSLRLFLFLESSLYFFAFLISGFFVFQSLVGSSLVEGFSIVAASIATLLPKRYRLIPFGLSIGFLGKSQSFYLNSAPEIFFATTFFLISLDKLLELSFSKNRSEIFVLPKLSHIELFFLLSTLAFIFWSLFRSESQLQNFLKDCQDFGISSCGSNVLLAGANSPFYGLHVNLNYFLVLGLVFLGFFSKEYLDGFVKGTLGSFAIVEFLSLRHFINQESFLEFCTFKPLCDFAINTDIEWSVRFNSTFGNPSWYGQYVLLMLPITLIYSIRNKYMLLLFAYGVGQIIGSSQRIAWLGLSIFLGLLALFSLNRKARESIALNQRSLLIAVMITVVFSLITVYFNNDSILFKLLDYGMSNRDYIWQSSLAFFKNHPIAGVGTGLFYQYFQETHIKNGLSPFFFETAHNTLINIAVENGIIGVLLFVVLSISFCSMIWRKKSDRVYLLILSVTGAFIAISCFEHLLYVKAIIILLGLGPAYILAQDKTSPPISKYKRRIPPILLGACALATLAFRPGPANSCYNREMIDGIWQNWCPEEALWRIPRSNKLKIMPLDMAYTTNISILASANRFGPFEPFSELERGKVNNLDFEFFTDLIAEKTQWVYLKIIGRQAKLQMEHRYFSYKTPFVVHESDYLVANRMGLYPIEKENENKFRWSKGHSIFVVKPPENCPGKVALTILAPPINPNDPEEPFLLDFKVNEEHQKLSLLAHHEGTLTLAGDKLNSLEANASRTVNLKQEGVTDDDRNLAFMIKSVKCF